MKKIWMWSEAEDERDGWCGEHDTRESALEEIKTVAMTLGAIVDDDTTFLLAQVDGDQVEDGKELVFLGPKEKITLESLVTA